MEELAKIEFSDASLQMEFDEDSKELHTIKTRNTTVFFFVSNQYQSYCSKRCMPWLRGWPESLHSLMISLLQMKPIKNFWYVCCLFSNGFNNMVFMWAEKYRFLRTREDKTDRQPDLKIISAIKNMPAPANISTLRSFLGLVCCFFVVITPSYSNSPELPSDQG